MENMKKHSAHSKSGISATLLAALVATTVFAACTTTPDQPGMAEAPSAATSQAEPTAVLAKPTTAVERTGHLASGNETTHGHRPQPDRTPTSGPESVATVATSPEEITFCNDLFKELILQAHAPSVLVADVWRAKAAVAAEFAECGPDVWDPHFLDRSDCDRSNGQYTIGTGRRNVGVSRRFIEGNDADRSSKLGRSYRSPEGDILIHFAQLPGSELGACWYYQAHSGEWYQETFRPPAPIPLFIGTESATCNGVFGVAVYRRVTYAGPIAQQELADIMAELKNTQAGCSPDEWPATLLDPDATRCDWDALSAIDLLFRYAYDPGDGQEHECGAITELGDSHAVFLLPPG